MSVEPNVADRMIERCCAAVDAGASVDRLRAIVAEAVSAPDDMAALVPIPLDPDDDGVVYRDERLLIAHAVFPASYRTGIHSHGMPALIGVWRGYEDNHLFRRAGDTLVSRGTMRVAAGEVLALDANAVHDVHAPVDSWSGAIHVYVGDLLGVERLTWPTASSASVPLDNDAMEAHWRRAAEATGLLA